MSEDIDSIPLLANLHVHLFGTGDVDFWIQTMRARSHLTVTREACARAGLVPAGDSETVCLAALLEDPAQLRASMEMPAPSPGNFASSFVPRFVLRQTLAELDPKIVSELITWNAERLAADGVHYVEFSLGVAWFAADFVDSILDGVRRAESDHSVHIRFLAAFNRELISDSIHDADYLAWLAERGDTKLIHTIEPKHFEIHLQQLVDLRRCLDANPQLCQNLVGLDAVGDESNRPYAPFLLAEFRSFVDAMRRANPRFGVRLHMGEGINSDGAPGYVALRLYEHYVDILLHDGISVRAGHGLGLLGLSTSVRSRWRTRYPKTHQYFANKVQQSLKRVVIEINLTSNFFLLEDLSGGFGASRDLRDHIMGPLLREGFRVALGTDDPDLFAGVVSLRSEFKLASNHGLFDSWVRVEQVVKESVRASFADADTLQRLSAFLQEHYGVPLEGLLASTSRVRQHGAKETYQERMEREHGQAKAEYKKGNWAPLEDWYNKYQPP